MSALDAISRDALEEFNDQLKSAIECGDRYFSIKPHDNMRRVMVALDEWLEKWEKPSA